MPSPRGTIEFLIDLDSSGTMYLAFSLGVGGGPFEFAIFPSDPSGNPQPYDLGAVLEKLAEKLGIDALKGVVQLSNEGIWSTVFDILVLPELKVTPSGTNPSIQAVLKVFTKDEKKFGLTIGVKPIKIVGDVSIQIEPQITIYELGIQYTKDSGLKLDAVIDYGEVGDTTPPPTTILTVNPNGAGNAWTGGNSTKDKYPVPPSTQKVSYPFPMPATQDTASFKVLYLGLGQHFGLDVDLNNPNPISKALEDLEGELKNTTPAKVLPQLARYYHPDRDWFIAAHILLKGWDLKALFNDPALYGIEIASSEGAFKGFDFEILYQKLGPTNGVYYGAITIPEQWRTIELGAASLTLPNFKLWIYTNGDFRFAVGWPLWDDIFTVEVDIFTGGGGLYFGKLRSGDLPKTDPSRMLADAGTTAITYNPILEFGLGLELGLGRDFKAGPLTASLFVGMRGVFQGLLAWQELEGKPGSLSNPPDYHWFSASVSLVGIVNGSVDLAVVSLTFSVNIIITATVAFETDCKSEISVDAYVAVSATLKILFIHIQIEFHTTVHVDFTIGSGARTASPNGPTNQDFKNAIPSGPVAALAASAAWSMSTLALEELVPSALTPPTVALHFLLYPAVDYTQPADSQLQAVGGLIMESDQFLTFLMSISGWLSSNYGTTWDAILTNLGEGNDSAPANFRGDITTFLAQGSFTINGVDLTSPPGAITEISVASPTVITSAAHGLSGGNTIVIQGSNSTPIIDGEQIVVKVLTPDTFTIAVNVTTKGTAGTWTRQMKTYLFAMPPVLELSSPELSETRDFATYATTSKDYHEVLQQYLNDISQLDGRIIGHSGDDDGHSMANLIFYDYLLLVCRQLAHQMATTNKAITDPPTPDDANNVGGMVSRFLLHGLRLPKPGTQVPAEGQNWDENDIAGLYTLTGQQFPVKTPNGDSKFVSADLSLSPSLGLLGQAFKFTSDPRAVGSASAQSVTSHLPLPASLPPAPSPDWSHLSQQPGIGSAELWLGVHNRVQWTHNATTQGLIQMPPRLQELANTETVTLKIYPQPQPPAGTRDYPFTYALRIPLDISTVSQHRDAHATWSGTNFSPIPTEIPRLYRIQGVDDADRDRLGKIITALGGSTPPEVELHVLLPLSDQSAFTSNDQDEAKALFLKTSLSTTSSPGMHTAPIETLVARAMAALAGSHPLAEIGPVAAPITDVSGVLQLLYEASIVHSSGFFLNWPGSDNNGLPTNVFKDGTAELELLVLMSSATSIQSDIQNVLVTESDTSTTVYLAVMDEAGKALPDPHPSQQQGSIGFDMEWQAPSIDPDQPLHPFDPSVIQSLYHLIQFRVNGYVGNSYGTSMWSGAVGPMKRGNDSHHSYLVSLPVWKFVTGIDPTNPIQALAGIGQDPTLDFRLVDVFGNALTNQTHPMTFNRPYEDPLVLPSTWPGAHISYSICGDGKSDPTLVITLSFLPNKKWSTQNDLSHLIKRYQQIVAQVSDPNLTVELATSLMKSAPEGNNSRPNLESFAKSALAYLQDLLNHKTPSTVADATITAALTRSDASELPYNIFQLTVDMTLSRPEALVDPDALDKLPAVQSITLHVPPHIVQDPGDSTSPFSLKGFGRAFEAAYAGFDGQTASKLKLTVRAEKTNHASQIGPADLWAVRMSSKSGIALSFPSGGTSAAFTMAPMSKELVSGTVDVTTYNASLTPTTTSHTFNGIALDDWMRAFLFAMDFLLSPSSAPVIARLPAPNPDQNPATPFKRLMDAKEDLAKNLATQKVIPVFETSTWEGDLATAQDKFEQSLLESLSRAYTISVIMQTQINVSETGTAEKNVKVPPRFYGALPPHERTATNNAFTISSATLALPEAEAPLQQALTWTMSAKQPEDDAFLSLNRDFNIGFMEHYIDLDADGNPVDDPDEQYGYVPSTWLRFVVTEDQANPDLPDPLLNYALPAVQAPIPLHEFPPTPSIASQNAQGDPQPAGSGAPIKEIIDDALEWDYTLTVAERELEDAQDDLWLIISYNLPGSDGSSQVQTKATVDPLFTALAKFTASYQSLSDNNLLSQLQVGAPPPDPKLAGILADLAEDVSGALAPVPTDEEAALEGNGNTPVVIDTYVVEFLKAHDENPILTVYAQVESESDNVNWPEIDGKIGTPSTTIPRKGVMEGLWKTATYPYTPLLNGKLPKMEIKWTNLHILSRQTVRSQVQVLRNADLATGNQISNPLLVYTTPLITTSRLVPHVDVSQAVDVPFTTDLSTTLKQILEPLLSVDQSVGPQNFKVKVGYEYALSTDPQGNSLVATHAILLVNDLDLSSQDSQALDQFVNNVSNQISAWMKATGTNNTLPRWITLAISLFANLDQSNLPLLSLDCLRIKLPDS